MDPKKITIVLVEDEPVIIQMYSLKFKLAGFNLIVSPSASMAIETIKKNKADLVLLDLQLENDINGLDILKTLKSSPETEKVLVYILSNKRDSGNKENAVNAGAVDFLSKIDTKPETLIKIITEKVASI